jgi:hypothetical protein
MRTCKSKLSKTITANNSANVPNRAWEEDELPPTLHFPLDLWRTICTHLKNKRLISLTTYFKIYIYSDYYLITTVTFTYQKLSASEYASATCALSRSCISCLPATRFDF